MGGAKTRPRLDHAVAIGATGMLAVASCEIARRTRVLTSIARTQRSLDALHARIDDADRMHERIALDYRDGTALGLGLERSVELHGPIDLVLAWIHEDEPRVALSVARKVGGPARFVHVLGSAAGSPEDPAGSTRKHFLDLPEVDYQQVILGFHLDDGRSRWLQDDEISAGVTSALEGSCKRLVVGTVTPWSARP